MNRRPVILELPWNTTARIDKYWRDQVEVLRAKATRLGDCGMSSFARTSAFNAFLAENVRYVLQGIYCLRIKTYIVCTVFLLYIVGARFRSARAVPNIFRKEKIRKLRLGGHLLIRQLANIFISSETKDIHFYKPLFM